MLLAHAVKFHEARDWYQATRPIYTYLHLTPQSLQTPRTMMQTVSESTIQRQSTINYTLSSNITTLINTPRCHHCKVNMP